MGTNEEILKKYQGGFELARGTNVAATRIIYAQISGTYDKKLMEFADQSGTYEGRRRAAYGREKVSFRGVDILTFEDAPWWFQLGIKGGVAGAGDGGSPIAYKYAFTPSLATDDLKSMTLEHGEPGNVYETAQVMVNQFTLRMDSDNDSEPGWMIDTEMMGLDWASSAYTSSILDRVTEVILARGTQVFIDDGGGTMGATQKTGSLISASITYNNQIHFKAFSENATGYAPNKVGRKQRLVDAQLTVEFDSDAEFAKYRNSVPQQRMIRLKQTGSQIHAGSPAGTANKYFQVDLWGYWNSIGFGNRDGNLTATFGLAAFYDPTATAAFKTEVNNALQTLP